MSRATACGLLLSLLTCGARADAPSPLRAEREKGRTVRVVADLDAANATALRAAKWDAERWQALLAVSVEPRGRPGAGLPAMLGTYTLRGDRVVFEPRFPFAPGTRYRATLDPARLPVPAKKPPLTIHFGDARPKKEPTVVSRVYPTADRLPENQLKFYVHFSAPMARGGVYRHIKLLDAAGKQVQAPFLELGEELWDPTGTRFTLFFDPGRIKRGLKPREEVGPALVEGKKYTLVIDRAWRDADDAPLAATFRKTFTVGKPDDACPDPKKWKLTAPAAGSRGPLTVRFEKPLDHALLHRMVWVVDGKGRKLAGTVAVDDGEQRWRFTPKEAWRTGEYHLEADTRLEDLAGNTIGKPFEVDVLRPVERRPKKETARVPFRVSASEPRP